MTTRKINVTHGKAAAREMASMERAAKSQQISRPAPQTQGKSMLAAIEKELARRKNGGN